MAPRIWQRFALITLPDGGSFPSSALFYCTGTVNSNGLGDLYYARAGVAITNLNSYDPTGCNFRNRNFHGCSHRCIDNLPVKFVSFDATKRKTTHCSPGVWKMNLT